MSPAEIALGLLAEFDAAGIELHVVGGRLRAWPSEAVTHEVRAIIEPFRAELLAAVTARAAAGREAGPAQGGAPVAEAQAAPHEPASCVACLHCTRVGNCARPIEAGLSAQFELIAHPAGGAGCAAFEPGDRAVPNAVRGAIDRCARARAWSDADEAFALDVAARCPDPDDWLELAELVEATAAATDAGRRAGDHHHEVPR